MTRTKQWNSRKQGIMAVLLAILSLATGASAHAQTNLVTPAEWLAAQPKPNFASGHHLPHLTKWSWPFSYELTAEMGTNWGYALDLGWAMPDTITQMSDSNSTVAKLVSLATNYPDKFAICVEVWRTSDSFTNPPAGLYCTNSDGLFVDRTGTNYFSGNEYQKVFSPEGPDDYWASVSDYQASFISAINDVVPIKIVLNGGEYGLGVVGFDAHAWQQDPRVQASAVFTNAWNSTNNTSGMSYPHYASIHKASQLNHITTNIQQRLPDRELYIYYDTGNEQSRFVHPGYSKWEDGWSNWGFWSQYMVSNTDLPSFESYYVHPTSWTNVTGTTMFNTFDLLTRHLNAVGYNQTKLGKTNSYDWVSGGWSNTDTNVISDIPHYMGFLKCLYTSGTVGAAAGYFSYPTNKNPGSIFGGNGFNASFPSNSPPNWLLQIEALSRVHAQFSHLENYIFNGDLLPGNGNLVNGAHTNHFMSVDQPSYEFTNNAADSAIRVLARKKRDSDDWLVCAWAAGGTNRNVTVTIPKLGSVRLLARDSGSVYTGTTTNLTLMDVSGVLPTQVNPISTPRNFRVMVAPTD